jgi:predicted alpha/beta hydrolase family esterase
LKYIKSPTAFLTGSSWLFTLVLLLILSACATPAQRVDRKAVAQGYDRLLVKGLDFTHIAYIKGVSVPSKAVHIYIEGDGRPWIWRHIIAKDPTSTNTLMLKLMRLDSAPSVYLGRPCYYGAKKSDNCSRDLWTSERYSSQVVASMNAALLSLIGDDQPIVLMGHSGGGALAMLMAEHLPNVQAVVTIAGNLDIEAWTELHRYIPLEGSLNPASRPPLSPHIYQLHLAGGHDDNVAAEMIERVARQQNAEYRYIEKYNHICCWKEIWPEILSELEKSQP